MDKWRILNTRGGAGLSFVVYFNILSFGFSYAANCIQSIIFLFTSKIHRWVTFFFYYSIHRESLPTTAILVGSAAAQRGCPVKHKYTTYLPLIFNLALGTTVKYGVVRMHMRINT